MIFRLLAMFCGFLLYFVIKIAIAVFKVGSLLYLLHSNVKKAIQLEKKFVESGIKGPSKSHAIFGHAILRTNPMSHFFHTIDKELGFPGMFHMRIAIR